MVSPLADGAQAVANNVGEIGSGLPLKWIVKPMFSTAT